MRLGECASAWRGLRPQRANVKSLSRNLGEPVSSNEAVEEHENCDDTVRGTGSRTNS